MRTLNTATIDDLPNDVSHPRYDRQSVTVGIMHLGVGGFHRAHMAMTLDRLMNAGKALDWGICGVGLMASDRRMDEVLRAQDCLYSLTLKHPDGHREASVIGSIVEYLFAPDDVEAVIAKMASAEVRIVSLTITEGGYNFDRVTGEFDLENSAVRADLTPGATPSTAFGIVTEALRRRRLAGTPAFTVLSCDNIQGNGDMTRKMFTAFANAKDSNLGEWVNAHVAFPNSMVDRITPVTSDDDIAQAQERTGLFDGWPVVAEPFFQWVVEDHFPLGRPPLEDADVQMVADVMPYELMKLRLLNASHQALCYFGYLSGYRYAHEALSDPLISRFLLRYMNEEATPTLLPVPGINLADYKNQLIERFSNAEVRDTLARLCAESSDRIPKWLVPVIREQIALGGPIALSAAIVASWARYAEGVDEQGNTITVVDNVREDVMAAASAQRENTLAFIENRNLFGDLAENEIFANAYATALVSIFEVGAHAALEAIVQGE